MRRAEIEVQKYEANEQNQDRTVRQRVYEAEQKGPRVETDR